MQLILTHADLELALIESLRAKGMTAFEPGKASVEFTFKRGTKELQCILDTEPKAPAEPAEAKPKTETPVAPVAETSVPVAAADALAEAQVAQAAEDAGVAYPAAEATVASAGDDNLFD